MTDQSSRGLGAEQPSPQIEFLLNIPVIAVTGMSNQFTNTGDLSSVFYTNGRPSIILNMNMIVAKSYVNLLSELIAKYESMTGSTIDTMAELQAKFDRSTAIKVDDHA